MTGNTLFKNSYFSVLQAIATAIVAILLFKLSVVKFGLAVTGLWSFLSSFTAITAFGSSGFANSLLHFIPKYKRSEDSKINSLINTSFFSVLAISIVLCLLGYAVFRFIIPLTVSQALQPTAVMLLPFVVVTFFFSSLSANFLSVLDGLLLMHIRAKLNIAGSGIFLFTAIPLLFKIGIVAIPLAQLIQHIFLLCSSYYLVKREVIHYQISLKFDRGIFKEIFHYGFSFQLLSITQISDPFMKAMITRYAGSDTTAIFDFCVKLLSVFRSLIIAANQSIVPQIAIFQIAGKQGRVSTYYKANFKLVLLFSLLFFLCPIVLSDSLSFFFLNKNSSSFNFILLNVAGGLFINALAFPAHFHYLGTGNLKWNVINNAIITGLIFILAPLLGAFIGGPYIIMSWSIAATVGSIVLIASFGKDYKVSITAYFDKDILLILIGLLAALVLSRIVSNIPALKNLQVVLFCINSVLLVACLILPLYNSRTVQKIRSRFQLRYGTISA